MTQEAKPFAEYSSPIKLDDSCIFPSPALSLYPPLFTAHYQVPLVPAIQIRLTTATMNVGTFPSPNRSPPNTNCSDPKCASATT